MKTYCVPQIVAISKNNAADFAAELNSTVVSLARSEPEIKFDDKKPFTAYVIYKLDVNVADSVKDEYHADGIYFTCAQCPLHDIETDGRKRTVPCKYSKTAYTRLTNEACEVFYRRLMLREIEPKSEPVNYIKRTGYRSVQRNAENL